MPLSPDARKPPAAVSRLWKDAARGGGEGPRAWRGVEGRDADVDERAISGATVQARHERAYEANPCAPKLHLRGERRATTLPFERTYEANSCTHDLCLPGEKRSAV